MSRNGSGTYNLPVGNPVTSGSTITSTWANSTLTDIANALTGSVAADGQTPMSGDLNMASNNIVSLADPSAAQDAATKAYVDAKTDGTASGSFTDLAYTGTLTGGTGVVNIGSGQVYKDASGNVGIGTSTPSGKLDASVSAGECSINAISTDTSVPAAYFNARGEAVGSNYFRALRGMNAAGTVAHWSIGQYSAPEDTINFCTNSGGFLNERMRINSSGNVLIGTTTAGASKLVVADNSIQINTAKTPASASATGTTGQICWDSSYVYVCVATNTWKRTAISTW